MNNRAAIYMRVSTEEQERSNQLPQLQELAARYSLQIVQSYEEDASAWKAGHQRELKRLMEDAVRRKFDVLLIWALDRLSREGPLAILTLVNRLKNCGVRVLSYQEPWTESPGEIGEVLFALVGWVARMESQRRSERTKAGLARAVAKGKKLGRPVGSKDRRKRKRRRIFITV